jgi:SAM-dependent methyltransferase
MKCFICDHQLKDSGGRYWRCPYCAHELTTANNADGTVTNDILDAKRLTHLDKLTQAQRAVVRRVMKANEFLVDIGCGTARFLYHTATDFKNVSGVEVDPRSIQFARDVFGLKISESLPDRLPLLSMVTLWHALEHLPVPVIEKYFDILRHNSDTDTRLLICVPNASSFQSAIFGADYAYYDFPAHIHQFNLHSVDLLMKKFGFAREGMTLMPIYVAFGWSQGILNKLIPIHNYFYYRRKRGWTFDLSAQRRLVYDIVSLAMLPLILPIAAACTALEYFFPERRGVLTVWYRKTP